MLILTLVFLAACGSQDQDQLREEEQPVQEELSDEEIDEQLDRIEAEYEADEEQIGADAEPSYSSTSPFTGMPLAEEYYKKSCSCRS